MPRPSLRLTQLYQPVFQHSPRLFSTGLAQFYLPVSQHSTRLFSTRLTQFYRPVFQHSTALSFSDDPLQADQIIGWTAGGAGPSLHIGFKDNPHFKSRLASILEAGYTTSRYLTALARTHGHGYMHIVDGRSMTAFGRCPDPDDIFATVLVQDGAIVPGSLEPMPMHRLLTVNGLFRLPAEFNAHLFK